MPRLQRADGSSGGTPLQSSGDTPTPAGDAHLIQQPCAKNPDCPDDFCKPFPTKQAAIEDREKNKDDILSAIQGIPGSGPKCLPLFAKYLMGGTSTQLSLDKEFADDFARSRATRDATVFLSDSLKVALNANPPKFPPGGTSVIVKLKDVIPDAVRQIDTDKGPHALVFDNPFETPGLLAGGIGKDEADCRVGAVPSDFPDRRLATGDVKVIRNPDGSLLISPSITFTVDDTLDFCPGNCGGILAQWFGKTVLMSRYEASWISGDVPFTVSFPAPPLVGAFDSED
jgi:hypothetical protein